MNEQPQGTVEVIAEATFGLGLCCPGDWSDEQITEYANRKHPTGGNQFKLSSWTLKKRIVCEQDPARVHAGLVF